MPTDPPAPQKPPQKLPQKPPLTPAADRALAEAEARRTERARQASEPGAGEEINGPKGPEPTRYGDWEINGIASDF